VSYEVFDIPCAFSFYECAVNSICCYFYFINVLIITPKNFS
jgi:hypothetical protein